MKRRLDELLVSRHLAANITAAQAMIIAGEVLVADRVADKPGAQIPVEASIRVREKCRYVSRGGLKLEQGLDHFQIDVTGLCCIDVGASSGGFTDCLLQHGAAKVFAVDVAYGQLDWKIRQDGRVTVIERFNARNLTPDILGEPVQLAVMDTSFISITALIPTLLPLFSPNPVQILSLIKPQFELPRHKVGRGGVVREEALHEEAIDKIRDFAATLHLGFQGVVPSPILGPKGNKEFLTLLTSSPHTTP